MLVIRRWPGQAGVEVPGRSLSFAAAHRGRLIVDRWLRCALIWTVLCRAPCEAWLERGLPVARSSSARPRGTVISARGGRAQQMGRMIIGVDPHKASVTIESAGQFVGAKNFVPSDFASTRLRKHRDLHRCLPPAGSN